jgi:hypothetical protein
MESFQINSFNLGITVLTFFVLAILYLSYRSTSPIFAIFSRWTRWIFFSLSFSFLLLRIGVDRPYWVLFITAFLLWFLIESVYYWIAITALSKSEFPLYPHFKVDHDSDECLYEKPLIKVKQWLQDKGFTKKESLKAQFQDIQVLHLFIYEDKKKRIQMHLSLSPLRRGKTAFYCAFSSITKDGSRLITDNFFFPFGGFYPKNWLIERRPWTRNLNRLKKIHDARMQAFQDGEIISWEEDPLADYNQQQKILENINIKQGLLFPGEYRQKYGKLTKEGRYRFWKEIWLINYLGLAFTN